jgi:hypothetical protein
VLPPGGFCRLVFGNAGQNNRVTVGKFSHQRQASADSLHSPAENGNQQVAAPFDLRDAFLADIEGFCDLLLCNLARPAQFLQRHFLGNELGGASLDFPGAALGLVG